MASPRIGITADIHESRYRSTCTYAEAVSRAGGLPLILPAIRERLPEYLELCDGFVFSGGDDPNMETWGEPTHPKATRIHSDRQVFELELLAAIDQHPERPALGICLGMQLMGLHAQGALDQHLPDSAPDAAATHWGHVRHQVVGDLGWGPCQGEVLSHHRQVIVHPGNLVVAARAHDDRIEAIRHPHRAFYLGVQWHPEKTADPVLGDELFHRLIIASQRSH